MCEGGTIEQQRRHEAIRRAQRANKCDVLKIIDQSIKVGGSIYDVLERVVEGIDMADAGAGDTARALLRLEGWKG